MAWLLAWGPLVHAVPALSLEAEAERHDLWPAMRLLDGPQAAMQDWALVLALADRFVVPETPHANLGPRTEPVWLHATLEMPPSARTPDWLLDIDYPSLDRVDVYLVREGVLHQQARLGDTVPAAERPLRGRTHALALDLRDGPGRYELLLRVTSTSTLIVPAVLVRPEAFHAREEAFQLGQGMTAGLAASLLLYSLVHWVRTREALFGYYALLVASSTLFFLAYNGLGPQHLWPRSPWLIGHAAPLAVLLALCGAFHFMRFALDLDTWWPRLSRTLAALGVLAAALAAAFTVGLLSYRTAHALGSALGPVPMLLGLPAAWLRMRRGDRAARYLIIGWGGYAVTVVMMAALLRGRLGADFWTLHAFQFGATFEMLMWQVVLGQRVDNLHAAAVAARSERDAYQAMAFTDPLTGVLNRRGLLADLKARLFACGPERMTALYLIDLDGFKAVNDTLGHDAGDLLLQAVARRLSAQLRAADALTRLGGDEFVVVADGLVGEQEAHRLGQKLLAAFDEPFELAGAPCIVGLTIGYALAPLDTRDPEALLRLADAAMYTGKRSGKQCLRRPTSA